MMSSNYFVLFNLPQQFSIDVETLEANYRKLQSEAHPDRFVAASMAEKLQSMQTSTLANEAYRALKSPANRAKYLLELQAINAVQETNTSMPTDFLMQQMEWREQLEDAKQVGETAELEKLLAEMQLESRQLQAELTVFFDEKHDLINATETTRKLIFMDKVCEDIVKAIELLES